MKKFPKGNRKTAGGEKMEAECPDILEALKVGELRKEKIFFCEACGKTFDEIDDYRMIDRFGRCFCSPKCREKYYSRD